MGFFRALWAALFENKSGFPYSRAERRRRKKMAGRMNPDGKYFGGVKPDREHKIRRYVAGR